MADINRLARLVSGELKNQRLNENTLVLESLKVNIGTAFVAHLTGAALTANRDISIPDANVDLGQISTNASNISTLTTNINNLVSLSGVTIDSTNLGTFTGITIPDSSTIKGALQALETALEEISVDPKFSDADFRILNDADATKEIAFDASSITAVTTRTISMPDADVDLADVNNALLVDGTRLMSASLNMDDNKVINLLDPTDAQDAATKAYVDTYLQGLEPKGSVQVATLANIVDLSDVGVALEIDGYTVQDGDRVLVKNQSSPALNGVYDYDQTGEQLVRSADFDGNPSNEVKGGDWVYVEEGTQAGTSWAVLGQGNKDVGTDSILWTKINKVTPLQAGTAIDITNDEINAKYDDLTIGLSSDELAVKANGIDDTHIRLRNNEYLRARNNANDGDVNILRVLATDAVDMASFFFTPSSAPTQDYHVANKKYVDDSISNINQAALTVSALAGEALGTGVKALRWAKGAETAGRLYFADNDATTNRHYDVVALYLAASEIAGDSIVAIKSGEIEVTAHGFTIGEPIYLSASGALTNTAPSADDEAVVIVGYAKTANLIDVQIQIIGIN